jgi:hypothetical protein
MQDQRWLTSITFSLEGPGGEVFCWAPALSSFSFVLAAALWIANRCAPAAGPHRSRTESGGGR